MDPDAAGGRTVAVHLIAQVLLERPDGRILLARRSGVSYGDGRWGTPGGHAAAGESLVAAAIREAREEIGVGLGPADLHAVGVQHYLDGDLQGLDVFFRARRWAGEPRPVAECSEVGWFFPDDLPADALDWLGPVLRRFLVQPGAGVQRELFAEAGFTSMA